MITLEYILDHMEEVRRIMLIVIAIAFVIGGSIYFNKQKK